MSGADGERDTDPALGVLEAERSRLEVLLRERAELLTLDAEANRALAESRSLRDTLQTVAQTMAARLHAAMVRIWTTSAAGDVLELQASAGEFTHVDDKRGVEALGTTEIGRIASSLRRVLSNELASDPEVPEREWALREGMVSFAGHPLVVEGRLVGVLAIFSRHHLSDATAMIVESLSWSIAQAVDRRRVLARLKGSERWYATTLSSIGDGVVVTDTAGLVTFLNPVAEKLTGWTAEAARGLPLIDVFPIFHETTGRVVENPVEKVLREGHIVGLANHTVLRQRGGKLIPIEDSAAPVFGVDGRMTGVVLVFHDASHARDVELERERLLAREQEARQLAERASFRSDVLVQTSAALAQGNLDVEGTLLRLVQVVAPQCFDWASVWGVDAQKRVGRVVSAPGEATDDAPPAGAPGFQRRSPTHPVQQAVDDEQTLVIDDLQGWMRRIGSSEDADTVQRLGLTRAVVVPIRVSGAIAAVLSVADTEERRAAPLDAALVEGIAHQVSLALSNARLHARSEQLRAAAEDATLVKDQFLARVSHDLRNPLGSILGWANLIRSQRADAAYVAKGLDIIERSAKAQVQLIEDLLDVSRITAGKLKLELAKVPVAPAIEAALDAARLAATAKRVHLEVAVEADVGIVVVDPDRFQQVIWNLASNAVKFSRAGGEVKVSAARRASRLEVVVADEGCGITPEFLPYVFNTFEQADPGSGRSGGLGLGLAITRHIVELHGGTISVASDGVDRGARFTVDIPIRAALPSTAPGDDDVPPSISTALAGCRILVVDDEDDAREILTAMLERAGATVLRASSADEALATLQAERPVAIVSDVGMPEKSGYDLVRELRALRDEDLRRIPAVALTALARSADRVKALSSGFFAHVPKPVEPQELILVLTSLLKR